jgi:hypothetical protein
METGVNHQERLQSLARLLQAHLRSRFHSTPIQLQCALKQGELFVLGQHPPDSELDRRQVFGVLQAAMEELPSGTLAPLFDVTPATVTVRFYLRVLGQKQPYAAHTFEYALGVAEVDTLFPEELDADAIAEQVAEQVDAAEGEPTPVLVQATETATEAATDEAGQLLPLDERLQLPELAEEEKLTPVPEIEEPILPRRSSSFRPKPLFWVAIAAATGIVAFVSSAAWMFSRPCMVGACQPIEAAQALEQQAEQQFRTANTGQDLQQIQQQLTEVRQQLESVPSWAGRYREAEQWQQTLRARSETLDQVLAAENRATEAIQKGQTVPQPVSTWQEVRSLWQQAIAQMESIPQTSPLSAFAQQRLMVYQDSLAVTNQRLAKEQQAAKKLAAAKSVAKVAEARQGVAQNPEGWQKAQVTWQVAVNALNQIANDTSSYTEAQQLLTDYQPKLMAVRDRATQEQAGNRAYLQAVNLAQRAKTLEQQNQWSQALATWRQALNSARQVPQNTFFYDQAQPLIASYSNSLKQAEDQFQQAVALQRVRADLNRVCSGNPRICTYTLTNDLIRVQFTPEYRRALRTAFLVGQAGNNEALGDTVHHLETLESALQTIANNSGLPVELYNPDNKELISSYLPQSS